MSAVFDNVRNGEYSIEYLKKMAVSALALSLGTYERFHLLRHYTTINRHLIKSSLPELEFLH